MLFAQVTAGTALTNADFIVEAAGARVESAAKTGGGEVETVGPGYWLGVIPRLAAQEHWSHAGSMDARLDWAVDYFSA